MSKTVFITGTSAGLGRETARLFQSKGWNVVATMRNPDAETELNGLDNVFVTRLDMLEPESIESAAAQAIERFGRIDVLVNNAGYGAYGPLEAFSRERILRQYHTNVIGMLDVTKALLPQFRKNKGGMIINISSIGGKVAFPLGALYHGTKYAIEGISEALSYEVEQFGGRVKIIQPGAIATDFAGRSIDFGNDESIPEYQPLVGALAGAFQNVAHASSSSAAIAEVIYGAATDGSRQLRYLCGADAEAMSAARHQQDDASFMGGLKAMFGIGG